MEKYELRAGKICSSSWELFELCDLNVFFCSLVLKQNKQTKQNQNKQKNLSLIKQYLQ